MQKGRVNVKKSQAKIDEESDGSEEDKYVFENVINMVDP